MTDICYSKYSLKTCKPPFSYLNIAVVLYTFQAIYIYFNSVFTKTILCTVLFIYQTFQRPCKRDCLLMR